MPVQRPMSRTLPAACSFSSAFLDTANIRQRTREMGKPGFEVAIVLRCLHPAPRPTSADHGPIRGKTGQATLWPLRLQVKRALRRPGCPVRPPPGQTIPATMTASRNPDGTYAHVAPPNWKNLGECPDHGGFLTPTRRGWTMKADSVAQL